MKIRPLVSVLDKVFSDKMKMVENTVSLASVLENVFSDKMGVQTLEDG